MWLKKHSGPPEASLEKLGSLESEIMERVWARGETSVRDLHAEFAARLAYTTVMTTLDRLYKKGLLNRRKQGKAFLYTARMSKTEYQGTLTRHLLGMALQDIHDTQVVLSSFVEQVSKTGQPMLDHLEKLVKAKRRALRRKSEE
ncbi:MAG TPA: BlaI/MecI/CopY family transcriptional regulator [Candidatus Saccharimonadales bacterium]|jgi:predicted transcriptional regulator|nr:BlaI/MecI/CopY family transcriptional regulator [Candidatus Saccharimonadales bacterium]